MGAKAHINADAGLNSKHALKSYGTQAAKTDETIKGIVKDSVGQPLIGVNVAIKGTNKGTQTGVNGGFTIQANVGDVLVFTYIGFLKKE